MKPLVLLLFASLLAAQSENGELRIAIQDKDGLAIPASVQLMSEANDYRETAQADSYGIADFKHLSHGKIR